MANQPVALIALPGGGRLWFGDTLPTLASDGSYQAGDFFWITSTSAGVATLYKCITGTSGSTAAVWQAADGGVATKTTALAYTALPTDSFIVLTGNVQITLPAPSSANIGKTYTIKRVGAANGTVVSTALEAGTTATFAADLSAIVVTSDGSVWRVISTYGTVNLT